MLVRVIRVVRSRRKVHDQSVRGTPVLVGMPYARRDADDAGRLRREVDFVVSAAGRGAFTAVEECNAHVAPDDEVAVWCSCMPQPLIRPGRIEKQ